MRIQKTTAYGSFKIITGNRSINKTHLRHLIASISENNMLDKCPIIVNEKKEVIDGQHRLMAAKHLKVPIYFIVHPAGQLATTQMLNSNMKNWSLADFVDSYIKMGNEQYAYLKQFSDNYKLPLTISAKILLGVKKDRMGDIIRDGSFVARNKEEAVEIANVIVDYRRFANKAIVRSRDFLEAIIRIVKEKKASHALMMERFEASGMVISRQPSSKEYLRVFEDIYNFRKQKRVAFV